MQPRTENLQISMKFLPWLTNIWTLSCVRAWHWSPQRANMRSIPRLLMKAQLRWAGHGTRMTATHFPNQIFFRDQKNGRRVQVGLPPARLAESHLGRCYHLCNKHDQKCHSEETTTQDPYQQTRPSRDCYQHIMSSVPECSGLRLASSGICALTVPQTHPNESCHGHHQTMMDDQGRYVCLCIYLLLIHEVKWLTN